MQEQGQEYLDYLTRNSSQLQVLADTIKQNANIFRRQETIRITLEKQLIVFIIR